MPRIPGGFHRQSGSGQRGAFRQGRYLATPQQQYWRRTVAELRAGAAITWPSPLPPFNPSAAMTASAGPQGAGEQWTVDLARVASGALAGMPPLVVQQIAAQVSGQSVSPPPPVVAQIWLAVAGQLDHLLAQTTQGGNDDVSVGGQQVTPGETIAVVWYGLTPGVSAWFSLRGTKYVLDT